MSTLVLIDGPNTFNDVDRWFEKSDAPHDKIRRDYFRDWFDLDRLVYAAIEQGGIDDFRSAGLGAVIFHSDKAVGRSSVRLSGADSDTFWGRQASVPGMSSVLVTVPGFQPERSKGTCPAQGCGQVVTMESVAEKGVDTSMVTYLYEALDEWHEVVLVTNDADFVPPIQALRRRGKKVFVAAVDSEGSGALKRACQTFFPVPPSFLERDIATYRILRPGGPLDSMLEGFGKKFSLNELQSVRIAASGRTPVIVLPQESGNWENFIGDEIGGRNLLTWENQSDGRAQIRVGSILDARRGVGQGMALSRNLEPFKGAKWLAHWRPFA